MTHPATVVLVALGAATLFQGCGRSAATDDLPSWASLLRTRTGCETEFVDCLLADEETDEDCVGDFGRCLGTVDPYNGLFGDLEACDADLHECLDDIYSGISEDPPCDHDDDEDDDGDDTDAAGEDDTDAADDDDTDVDDDTDAADDDTDVVDCESDPEAAFEAEEQACFDAYDTCWDPMTCGLQDITALGECYADFYDDATLGTCFQTLDECLLDIVAEDPYLDDAVVAEREVACFDGFNDCAGIIHPWTSAHDECEGFLADCIELVNRDPSLPEASVDAVVDACGLVYDYCLACEGAEDDDEEC